MRVGGTLYRWRERPRDQWRQDGGASRYQEQLLLGEGTDRERWVDSDGPNLVAPDAKGAAGQVAADMSFDEALMPAAGKALTSLAQGARSLTGIVTDPLFGESSRADIAAERAGNAPADAALWEEQTAASLVGGGTPYLLGGATAGTGLRAITAMETALGGIDYAGSGLERIINATTAGTMAAGAGALGSMASRVSQRIRGAAEGRRSARAAAAEQPAPDLELAGDSELAGALDADITGTATPSGAPAPAAGTSRATWGYDQRLARAEQLGYEPTPAQRSLDIGQEQWEAGRARQPSTSAEFSKKYQANQENLNRQVGRALGVGTGFKGGGFSIQPQVLDKAGRQIVRQMDEMAEQIGQVPVNAQALSQRIAGQALDITSDVQSVQPWLDALVDAAADSGGTVSGRQLMDARRSLTRKLREARAASKSNVPTIQAFIEGIDDMIQSSGASVQTINRFRVARERWRLLQGLQKGAVLSPEGNVRPRALVTRLNKEFPYEFARGNGMRWGPVAKSGAAKGQPRYGNQSMNELFDGARWMSESTSAIPNSGTPTGMAALAGGPTDIAARFGGNLAMKGYMRMGGAYPGATTAGVRALQGGGLGELGGMMPNIPAATAPAAAVTAGASSPFVEELLQ